jgi:hypothetical protein
VETLLISWPTSARHEAGLDAALHPSRPKRPTSTSSSIEEERRKLSVRLRVTFASWWRTGSSTRHCSTSGQSSIFGLEI